MADENEGVRLDWETAPKEFREHADSLKADLDREREERERERAELARLKRRERLDEAMREAEVDGITVDDLGEVNPDEITPTLVRVTAEEKQRARQAELEQQAKDLGFDSVEDMQAAAEERRRAKEGNLSELDRQAGVMSTGNPPREPEPEKSPREHASEAFQSAKERGQPEDVARAEYLRALRENRERTPAT